MHTFGTALLVVSWALFVVATCVAIAARQKADSRLRLTIEANKALKRLLGFRDEKIEMLKRHMAERHEIYERYKHAARWVQDDRDAAEAEVEKLKKEVDQLRVQLAGCSVAALGGTSPEQVAKRGSFGWSVAYQDVLDLRRRYENIKHLLHPDTVRSIERAPGA